MSTIVTKNSSTASAIPLAGDLVKGELAVNVTDKKLYTKDNSAAVVKIVGSLGNQEASAVAITGGTINNTSVGATTPSTGSFTTLNISGVATLASGSVLNTPTSAVLTNATGLPLTTGVTGTLPVANGGTGITSFGTGVATFLGTPSSANLKAAVTDETGSGALVFATSPTLVTPDLGTPSALVGTNITGTAAGLTAGNVTTNANLTGAVTSVGNATSLGSFTSSQLAGALTDETGSGSAVFATSPTLVTPALGTPSSATLTNATGLPISTGVSGLGSGVATFLATPTSSNLAAAVTGETGTGALVFATSPTLVTPALGTPASGVLTNATGLPITTGVAGLGTGVATFLATPSSANLAAAVTDETGSGALVFGTSPTITGGTVNPTTLQEGSVAAVIQTDIGTAPNEIPLNQYLGEMAYMNAEAVVIQPQASAVPNGIGDMVFQLTNNTTLVIKVKGSDGTVRSVTLTLA